MPRTSLSLLTPPKKHHVFQPLQAVDGVGVGGMIVGLEVVAHDRDPVEIGGAAGGISWLSGFTAAERSKPLLPMPVVQGVDERSIRGDVAAGAGLPIDVDAVEVVRRAELKHVVDERIERRGVLRNGKERLRPDGDADGVARRVCAAATAVSRCPGSTSPVFSEPLLLAEMEK